MRFSNTHKFVFVAKPKCGSSTIRKILDPYSDVRDRDINTPAAPWKMHTPARFLRTRLRERGLVWDDCFTFTSVRNPWALMVSQFRFAAPDAVGRYFWEPEYFPRHPMGFDRWLTEHSSEWHTLTNFADDANGNRLVNRVMLLENLDAEVRHLMRVLSLPVPDRVPVVNDSRTGATDYRRWYTDETAAFVEKRHSSDIMEGRYTFDGKHKAFEPYAVVG